jgi:hypothetical protein
MPTRLGNTTAHCQACAREAIWDTSIRDVFGTALTRYRRRRIVFGDERINDGRSLRYQSRAAIVVLHVITYSNEFRQQTPVGALGMNDFFNCGSRKAAWRSSTVFPLLQCSLRDL